MKKLMTTVAACTLAGAVFAQVESVNIVGYQTTAAPAGYSLYAPPFVSVGSATAVGSLAAITGTFADFDTIQFVDANGDVAAVYSWLTVAGMGVPADGWYDDAMNAVVLENMPQGLSYLLATGAAVEVLNSGEVNQLAIPVTAAAGFATVGNGTPTAQMLSDITFTGGITDFDTIQILDANGDVSAVYSWLTVAGMGMPADGWYDDAMSAVDFSVAPGQGFLLATGAGCTMTIPSPTAI